MSISRDDIESGKIDVSDVATSRKLPAVHPGDVLRAEFLEPLSLSVYRVAKDLKVQRSRLNEIALGQRLISAAMKAPNCAPVVLGYSAPLLAHAALISGVLAIFWLQSINPACASAGVPLGAHMPYQVLTV